MIPTLHPYPAYKDSGVPWLGQVPVHWEVRSLGSLTSPISERGQPDLPLLSVVREKGVIPRTSMSDDENHNFVPDDLSSYKVVRKGNLVINKMKAWQGSLGIASMDGIVSPAYFVFDFRIGDLRFGQALLRSKTYVAFFAQESDGVRIGQWDLSIHGMKRIPVVVPPLPEQTAIVRFLDYMDRRIRRSIRAKQKLIKLLEEYRQALIHQTVTGKIDLRTGKPYPAYKDSGVPWLGHVPEHWEVRTIKSLAGKGYKTFVDGDWIESPYIRAEGIRLIQTGNIGIGRYREKGFRFIDEETFVAFRCTEIMPGDVLICRLGDPVGRACLAPNLGVRMIASVDVCILKPNESAIAAFLVYAMSSPVYLEWIGSLVRGSTRDRVSRSMLGRFCVPLPPLPEQTAIVEYLDAQTAKLDAAIAAARREIELLREYRERLIADVVTGKVDVREVAVQLPYEPPEEEAELMDTDEIAESEGTDDDAAAEALPEEGVGA